MKHEGKQLMHPQFSEKHNKVAPFPSCYPAIISFQKHKSQFCKGWESFSDLWGRKKVSILPRHWNQASALGHDKTWVLLNDETQTTQSFSTRRKTTEWFMFSSKGMDTGITVPRPVKVCFSEKTLTVTDSSWLCQHQLKCCVYHLAPALLTIRHLLSTQLNSAQTTDHNRRASGKHPMSFRFVN